MNTGYRLLYDMVEFGYTEEDASKCNWDESKKKINKGEIGCIAIGSWAVSQFKEAGTNGNNIGFMPFPNKVDGKFHATIVMDYGYGVNAKSKNIDAAKKFVEKGNKVKVTLRFRGREMAHMNQSKYILDDFAESLADVAVVEKAPKVEGRSIGMVLAEKR